VAYARTVVESRDASALIDAEIDSFPRLQELYDGLIWRLARQPEIGYSVPETDPPLFLIHSRDWQRPGLPVIVLAYTYSTERVFVQAVRVLASAIEDPDVMF
jgi:hypothetical protein